MLGKVAFVTGGASGIGRALCTRLAGAGAHVVVTDVNAEGAEKVAASLQRGESMALDVTDAEAVNAAVGEVFSKHGGIDLMFNNAGIAIAGDHSKFSLDDWNQLVDVNIRGVVHGVHAAYPRMIKRGCGHIISTASMAGILPSPMFSAYAMTKHAVVGLMVSMRIEAEQYGVRFTAVCPGVIDTPLVEGTKFVGYKHPGRDNLPVKLYSVDDCARDILAGVAKNQSVVVVTGLARNLHRLYRMSPRLAEMAIGRETRKLLAKFG
jgi:NAD(P)-dependent dehydrogenase (short-subunit alcohol dehydrogenase family)